MSVQDNKNVIDRLAEAVNKERKRVLSSTFRQLGAR